MKQITRVIFAAAGVGSLAVWQRTRRRAHVIEMPTQYIVGDPHADTNTPPSTSTSTLPAVIAATPQGGLLSGSASQPPYQTPIGSDRGTRPVSASFTLRLSALEKWGVSAGDVEQQVSRYANSQAADKFGGVGRAAVKVADANDGYYVSVAYPDSESTIATATEAKRMIESIDPRLKGRVLNMKVAR